MFCLLCGSRGAAGVNADGVPKSTDTVILFVGPTGAGKSKLIQDLTRDGTIIVGHGMKPCTTEVAAYRLEVPQKHASKVRGRLFLVDTPGFDRGMIDDATVFKQILQGLKRWKHNTKTIAGIVYLSDIAQWKGRPSWKTMETFVKGLDADVASKLVFATTQWDKIAIKSFLQPKDEVAEMLRNLAVGAEVVHIQKTLDRGKIFDHLLGQQPTAGARGKASSKAKPVTPKSPSPKDKSTSGSSSAKTTPPNTKGPSTGTPKPGPSKKTNTSKAKPPPKVKAAPKAK